MIYGSVCSGIEAATVAWHPLVWRAAFFSEIEPFPRAVLGERWASTPLRGDFTEIKERDHEPISLLVGGTPCQDFSVAGLRAGLAGDRGGLTIEFVHLARRLRPRWLVWENVPGILSIDEGRAFGAFLGLLGQCGYGFAYRVLDAQHFGVPQRRRRVFVIGYLGDWRPAAAVLFEPESLRGDSPPRREARETVAASLSRGAECSGANGYAGRRREDDDNLTVASTSGNGYWWEGIGALRGRAQDSHENLLARAVTADSRHGNEDRNEGTLVFGGNNTAGPIEVATACSALIRKDFESETFVTGHFEQNSMSVRRLTPRECERLQGFPDNYTLIHHNGKPAADGPRYRALGNSMAVPVMRWLGERIAMIEAML